jgi:hypothetical protein
MFRARRLLAPLVLALLALPALLLPTMPGRAVSGVENRVLAPVPARPTTVEAWRRLPRAIDAYLADHFAFREVLVGVGVRVQKKLGRDIGQKQAVEGRDGWLFLSDGLLQSSGKLVSPGQADDYAAYVCEAAAQIRATGAKVLFTLVPSPGEIYPEKLPSWAGPAQRPTDYDRILARVRACGLNALDLRPALIAAKGRGLLYRRTESHWNMRGLTVGYDKMTEALGMPGWRFVARPSEWREGPLADGDLPRLAGLGPRAETIPINSLLEQAASRPRSPIAGVSYQRRAPYLIDTGRAGPSLLLIGDSFTVDHMPTLFAEHVRRFAWVHQDDCAFDWTVIERVKPDYVVIAPAEREARCRRGRPLHRPETAAPTPPAGT